MDQSTDGSGGGGSGGSVLPSCVPLTLTVTKKVDDIFYAIGDPDVYSMPYLFTLAPDCFYIPTVTVSNLPVFSEHNTDTKIFKVPTTTNLALIGSYVVSISSTITFPID